jgi:radical SAM superfamily enzyme YgiQ (UPF0313 family)
MNSLTDLKKIYFADLTHTGKGINSLTFPLGIALICSYTKKVFPGEFDIQLFKFPEDLIEEVISRAPDILALSCYSWNVALVDHVSRWVKKINPSVIIICGGPNFPVEKNEKLLYLKEKEYIDFYIENEGEFAFADLITNLKNNNYSSDKVKYLDILIRNTNYLKDGKLVSNQVIREKNIEEIDSPYTSGLLDKFFYSPLIPALETNRGCPFSCTYCADGIKAKNKVSKFNQDRVKDDINYIAKRANKTNELIITDLNFGMYKGDVETAQYITDARSVYKYPESLSASAGKNNPDRVMQIIKILKGIWFVSSSIQSTDPYVLESVKRSNISADSFKGLLEYGNQTGNDAFTFTEIILALPGDTKEKHFKSLEYGINNGARNIRIYQAMVLIGTEMATLETRKKYNLVTKYRVIPGAFGDYHFGSERHEISEIEEIIVSNSGMSFDDYVLCRKMDLVIDYFHNGGMFDEFYNSLKMMGISEFELLEYIYDNITEDYTSIFSIFKKFEDETRYDLYDSREEAINHINSNGVRDFLNGKSSRNELLEARLSLVLILDKTMAMFVDLLLLYLRKKRVTNKGVFKYYRELSEFILLRKSDLFLDKKSDKLHGFNYDFEKISSLNYSIDPRKISTIGNVKFSFFHTKDQIHQIHQKKKMYIEGSGGIAKMVQRTNLKHFFRKFIRSEHAH